MATKINVRSPYYLDITEPAVPTIAFDCTVANGKNLSIDQFGFISHAEFSQGDILSFTSSDSGFSNGKYATVSTETLRTIAYTLSIPGGFTNSDVKTFTCNVQATQSVFVCTGGVSANGSIPNQSIDAGGNTATIDLSSYFTASGNPVSEYIIDNPFPDFIDASITGNTLTLTTIELGGTKIINIQASDGDPLTCNGVQPIQITVANLPAFDCTTANLQGGEVAQDGTITDPFSRAEITAKSLTSGGTHITSVTANTGSSAITVTLFFDLLVPDGYSNAGDTFICSKDFTQQAPTTLPTFTCSVANITGTNIYKSGAVLRGSAQQGTIVSHTPTTFDQVTSSTPRTITYSITPPSTGFSNSGGSNISCDINLDQPPRDPVDVSGYRRWGMGSTGYGSQSDVVNSHSDFTQLTVFYTLDVGLNATDFNDLSNLVGSVTAIVVSPGTGNQRFIESDNAIGRFSPIYTSVRTRGIKTNDVYFIETVGSSIIGVWQYNNNRYSSGFKTFTQLY